MTTAKKVIYENNLIRIEIEENEIPWLKIFTNDPQKEFSQCKPVVRQHMWQLLVLQQY